MNKVQELEDWRIALEESQEKCKKLKKKCKKLKKRKKHCHYGDTKEKGKIKKRLRKTQNLLKHQIKYTVRCENEISRLRCELDMARNEMTYMEDVNKLHRKVDFLNNDSRYYKFFLEILFQELFPKFVQKYGKMPVDAEFKEIDYDNQK